MDLNWEDMKVALAVGRTGSLTQASRVLGVDQSTAGRRLTALEARIGAMLFARSKTGLTPTAAGEAVVRRAEEIERRVGRLSDDLARAEGTPVGLVRVMGNPWTLQRLAGPALGGFLARNPRLEVRLVSRPTQNPLIGDATVSLWFEATPREAEFAIKLGDVPYAVYGPTGAAGEGLDWVSFYDEDAPRRAPVRAYERLKEKGDRLALTATDAGVLLAAVRAGVGKGLLPMCLAEGAEGVARLSDGAALNRALHLHAHPDTVQTLRVQTVILWLRETFQPLFGAPDAA